MTLEQLPLFCFSEILLIVVILIPFIWLSARITGWFELSQKYPCHSPYRGQWKGWQWAKLRWSKSTYVWTAVAPEGLYLKLMPGFAFVYGAFFPTLCIPWSAIENLKERKYWWKLMCEITFIDSSVKVMIQRSAFDGAEHFLSGKLQTLEKSSKLIED